MAVLKISEYDDRERSEMSRMPNRVIQAFQPVVFQEVGYPTRVKNEYELFRYVDVMHEFGFDREFPGLLGGLTEGEFEFLKKLTGKICSFSEREFRMKAVARSCVINSLNILRHIRYLFATDRPKVMEIGAGCGYLGAMLLNEGYPYAAMDVSQAFYLYQNRLWNSVSEGNVHEMAMEQEACSVLRDIPEGDVVHMPWWEFVKLRPENVPHFDIVTCNHALCEMHPASLRFTLKIARALLEGAGGKKIFIFEGWGWVRNNSIESVTQCFCENGFSLVYCDSYITVFVPAGTTYSISSLDLPRKIKKQNLQLHEGRLVAAEEVMESYQPLHHMSPENPLSRAIQSGREQEKRTVGIEEVRGFYEDIFGHSDFLTQDEDFERLINYTW